MPKSVKIAADMGGWYYMWHANTTDYDGLMDELGLEYVAQNTEQRKKQPFLKGVNNQKPPRVNIGYGKLTDGFIPGGETVVETIGRVQRRIAPEKVGGLKKDDEIAELLGKTIKVAGRGKKVTSYTIVSATLVQ